MQKEIIDLDINLIDEDPNQPRKTFDNKLSYLKASKNVELNHQYLFTQSIMVAT